MKLTLVAAKKAGFRFSYECEVDVPEIPHVQDVLFALRLTKDQVTFDVCRDSNGPYIANVMLVAAVVRDPEVLAAWNQSLRDMQRIVAHAIVELSPKEAIYHVPRAYSEALTVLGRDALIPAPYDCPTCQDDSEDFDPLAVS